jgi:hypothetical protein
MQNLAAQLRFFACFSLEDWKTSKAKAPVVERQRTGHVLQMNNAFDRRIVDSVPCGIVQVSLEGYRGS